MLAHLFSPYYKPLRQVLVLSLFTDEEIEVTHMLKSHRQEGHNWDPMPGSPASEPLCLTSMLFVLLRAMLHCLFHLQ